MDPEFVEEKVEHIKNSTQVLERIFGLLEGTNKHDKNGLHGIIDEVIADAFKYGYTQGRTDIPLTEDVDEFTLGPCGCTDYHMADCPLMTDR